MAVSALTGTALLVTLVTGCSATQSKIQSSPSAIESCASAAPPTEQALGADDTLLSLVPQSPAHLAYDEAATANINNNEFRGLGLESWRDTAGCSDSFDDPATSDYEPAQFDDDSTPGRDMSVFLFLLTDQAADQVWGGQCSPISSTTTEHLDDGVLYDRANSDGVAGAAGLGHILIFVSGSQFADTDRATPLCQTILRKAIDSPLH